MIIKELIISNLFSFENTRIPFGKYTVITGHNGVGKSNIIRLFKIITNDPEYTFSNNHIEIKQKLNKEKNSCIKIRVRFSDEERSMISRLIFRNPDVKVQDADFILAWNRLRPNQQIISALVLPNKLCIWNCESTQKVGFIEDDNESWCENIFEYLGNIKNATPEEIKKITNDADSEYNTLIQKSIFQDLLHEDDSTKLKKYFNIDGRPICGFYNQDYKNEYYASIFEYCKLSLNTGNVDLWLLLKKIFLKNLVIINEFRPSINQFKNEINEMKSKGPIAAMTGLQQEFNHIFPKYNFDVEADDEIHFTIISEGKKFRLEDSASGYFEIIYMLNLIRENDQSIVMFDEPALHLHPIKQRHFWKFISETNKNQVIAITHSPYLVNLSLFQDENKLVNIQMLNGISKAYPEPTTALGGISIKGYNFKPEIFFSRCNIMVEGPSDGGAISAISDSLNNVFEKCSIQIVFTGGKDILSSYVPILKAYSIPHVALADYDYMCDNGKLSTTPRAETCDFIILEKRLEDELNKFDTTVKVLSNFDHNDPCKSSKEHYDSIPATKAYEIVHKAMSNNMMSVKHSRLGEVFNSAIKKAGFNPNEFW